MNFLGCLQSVELEFACGTIVSVELAGGRSVELELCIVKSLFEVGYKTLSFPQSVHFLSVDFLLPIEENTTCQRRVFSPPGEREQTTRRSRRS